LFLASTYSIAIAANLAENNMESTVKARNAVSEMTFHRGEYGYREENFENYRVGGFHPVLVGDVYNKYKIIRKLGAGSFSTVWLAENCR
jgi:hypothetical protein